MLRLSPSRTGRSSQRCRRCRWTPNPSSIICRRCDGRSQGRQPSRTTSTSGGAPGNPSRSSGVHRPHTRPSDTDLHFGKCAFNVRKVETAAAQGADNACCRAGEICWVPERPTGISIWFLRIFIIVLCEEPLLWCGVVERRQWRGLRNELTNVDWFGHNGRILTLVP